MYSLCTLGHQASAEESRLKIYDCSGLSLTRSLKSPPTLNPDPNWPQELVQWHADALNSYTHQSVVRSFSPPRNWERINHSVMRVLATLPRTLLFLISPPGKVGMRFPRAYPLNFYVTLAHGGNFTQQLPSSPHWRHGYSRFVFFRIRSLDT